MKLSAPRKFTILLIFVLSYSTAFADCRIPYGNTMVELKDGQTLSLLSTGGSLATHKTQDQDGIGTCYANTTSVILKSILPNNPDISYLHSAVESATKGVRQNWATGPQKYVRSKKSFVDGGFMCETMTSLKKTGGACRQEHSILENGNLNPILQEKIFRGLGKYFDLLNDSKESPQKLEALKQDLTRTLEEISMERMTKKSRCEEEKNKELPVSSAFSSLLARDYLSLKEDDGCNRDAIVKLATKDSFFGKDRVRMVPTQVITEGFLSQLNRSPKLKSQVAEYVSGKTFSEKKKMKFLQDLGKEVDHFLKSQVPSCQESPVRKSSLDLLGIQFLQSIKQAKTANCSVNDLQILDDLLLKNACETPTNMTVILEALSPLLQLQQKVGLSLEAVLLNEDSKDATQLKKVIFPQCENKGNLIPLDEMNCATFKPCSNSDHPSLENKVYDGPVAGCTGMEKMKELTKAKVYEGIFEGRALGVTVCTSFMVNPMLKTNFCRKNGPGVENHAYHSMAVSGVRCAKDALEYQLVNSWGVYNCPAGSKLPNSPLKCDKNDKGSLTGHFWVNEDVLVDSLTGLTEIKREKK